MDILNWVLYLVITCMIVVPFIGFTMSIVCDIYFKHKMKFIAGMVNGMAKGLDEALKKMKEKKNDPS